MIRTLHLTSPNMKGADVRAAQTLLATNKFGSFFDGEIDGEYGTLSSQASYLAKYFVGYAVASCKPIYGEKLRRYLSGETPLTPAMQQRRAARLKVAQETPLRTKALKIALTQIGETEHPADSNRSKFSIWYGVIGPWCAEFDTFCYVGAGSKSFSKGRKYAYVPYIVDDARANRNGLLVTHNPEPGDVVCYDWDGGVADHTGLFEGWTNRSIGTFTAIEGNTAFGNDSNGGQVMRRDRHTSSVVCFVRVTK